jgi:peptidoglycan/LPS O-acetylase OafA/YrhL
VSNGLRARASDLLRIDTVVPHRFQALDGYRAIAVLAVVTTHVAYFSGIVVSTAWGHAFSRMDIGVTIFFLLSGFLLFRPWSQAAMTGGSGPSTRTYFRRRLWRILPAYLVLVVVVLAVMPGIEVHPKHWLAHLSLTQVYWPDLLINGLTQTWSLATELSFYLVLPLMAWWVARRHRGDVAASTRRQLWALGVWAGIAMAWLLIRTLTPAQEFPVLNMWLPNFMDWFAVGMFFAVVHNRLRQPDPPRWMLRLNALADDVAVCLVVAVALFLLATTPVAGPYTFGEGSASQALVRHYLYLGASAALVMPGFLGTEGWGQWRAFLAGPLMSYLGTISYAIFLWHLFVLETGSRLLGIASFTGWFWILWPMTVVGTIAVAHFSYVLIERPAQRYSHRPGGRAVPRPAPQPTPAPAGSPAGLPPADPA